MTTPRPALAGTEPQEALTRLAAAIGPDLDARLVAAGGARAIVDGRCRELGLDLDGYSRRAAADPREAESLRRAIVPAETWFFRYPESFEHLRAAARQHARMSDEPFRVACLGCATGAEPYSVAAALDGVAATRITAVDRDAAALAVARSAKLGAASVRGAIPAWAHGALCVQDGAVTVTERLRDRVQFEQRDLLDAGLAEALGPMDAIFLRNVAIYLNESARRTLGGVVVDVLRPGGWLYLGHAETASALGLECAERNAAAFAIRSPMRAGPFAGPAAAAPPTPAVRARTPTPAAPVRPDAKATEAPRRERTATDAPAPPIDAIRRMADEGRHREALAAAEAAHARGERGAELLELLGTLALLDGRAADAERYLRAALYQDPSREAAALQLALLTGAPRG